MTERCKFKAACPPMKPLKWNDGQGIPMTPESQRQLVEAEMVFEEYELRRRRCQENKA